MVQRFPNIRLPTVGVHHFMLIGVIGFIGSCSPDHGGHNYNKNQRPVISRAILLLSFTTGLSCPVHARSPTSLL